MRANISSIDPERLALSDELWKKLDKRDEKKPMEKKSVENEPRRRYIPAPESNWDDWERILSKKAMSEEEFEEAIKALALNAKKS